MIFFSIVVCTRNGDSTLIETLLSVVSLKKSNTIDFELIIIDNASTDNTMSIAQDFLNENICRIPIRIYYEKCVGKTYAIQLAVTEAKYNYILLCDDDNILSSDFLIESEKIISTTPLLGVLGGFSELKIYQKSNPKWFDRYRHLYAIGPQTQEKYDSISETMNIWGAGMIFRKEIYEWVISKKFNLYTGKIQYGAYLAGEDFELCLISRILGYKNYYTSNLKIIHNLKPERLSWSSIKDLVIRNSFISIYNSLYYEFILNKDQEITEGHLKKHLSSLLYKSILSLFISTFKSFIGFFLSSGEGYSYQLVYHLAPKEIKFIFSLYNDRKNLFLDLVAKRMLINQL